MTPFLLTATVLCAPDTVTFERRAAPLRVVLKELGDAVGTPLSADTVFVGKNLLVRFAGTPKEEALKRVERATGGLWRDSGNGKVLVPDPAVAAKRKQADRAQIAAAFEKLVATSKELKPYLSKDAEALVRAEVKKSQEPEGEFDYKAYQDTQNKTTGHRALLRIIAGLGVNELMAAHGQRRTVWSFHPTQAQRRIPANLAPIVDQYMTESRAHTEAVKSLAPELNVGGRYNPLLQEVYSAREPVTDLLLVASSLPMAEGYTLTLWGYTVQGRVQIARTSVNTAERLTEKFEKPDRTLEGIEGEVKLEETSQIVLDALPRSFGGGKTLSEKVRAFARAEFERFETSEFFTSVVSDVVLQSLGQKGLDGVIDVSDFSGLVLIAGPKSTSKKLQDMWTALFGSGVMTMEMDEKGVVGGMNPAFPFVANLPKAAIQKFALDHKRNGVTIDNLADLVNGCDSSFSATMTMQILGSLAYPQLATIQSYDNERSYAALRIYARLDASTKQRVKDKGTSSLYSALPRGVQTEVTRLIFDTDDALAAGAILPEQPARRIRGDDSYDAEPTVRFPSGLPADSRVDISYTVQPRLFAQTTYDGGYIHLQDVDLEGVANQIAWSEKTSGEYRQAVNYGLGQLGKLTVTVAPAKDLFTTAEFKLMPSFAPEALVDWQKLPEEQRKVIAENLIKAREAYKDVKYQPTPPGRIKP